MPLLGRSTVDDGVAWRHDRFSVAGSKRSIPIAAFPPFETTQEAILQATS
jgi:hypothetical protein